MKAEDFFEFQENMGCLNPSERAKGGVSAKFVGKFIEFFNFN